MNKIREVQRLNQRELESCTPPSASWHAEYRHTAFVYIGGLPFNVTEGDVITIFSQYGEPVYLNMVRDKETGKSKGFAFLKYEDQRSCDLAVDNLGGAEVLGRIISVDHCNYKLKEGEKVYDNTGGDADEADGVEGDGNGELQASRPTLREEIELQRLIQEHPDDDPMKKFMIEDKQEEVEKALTEWRAQNPEESRRKKSRKHRNHRSERDRHVRHNSRDSRRRHRSSRPRSVTPSAHSSSENDRRRHRRRKHSRSRSRTRSPHSDSNDDRRRRGR